METDELEAALVEADRLYCDELNRIGDEPGDVYNRANELHQVPVLTWYFMRAIQAGVGLAAQRELGRH